MPDDESIAQKRLHTAFILGLRMEENAKIDLEVEQRKEKFVKAVRKLTPMDFQAITQAIAEEWDRRFHDVPQDDIAWLQTERMRDQLRRNEQALSDEAEGK